MSFSSMSMRRDSQSLLLALVLLLTAHPLSSCPHDTLVFSMSRAALRVFFLTYPLASDPLNVVQNKCAHAAKALGSLPAMVSSGAYRRRRLDLKDCRFSQHRYDHRQHDVFKFTTQLFYVFECISVSFGCPFLLLSVETLLTGWAICL